VLVIDGTGCLKPVYVNFDANEDYYNESHRKAENKLLECSNGL